MEFCISYVCISFQAKHNQLSINLVQLSFTARMNKSEIGLGREGKGETCTC